MPKRELLQAVVVQRDGERLKIKAGKVFDFTADELADIKKLNPDAIKAPQEAKEPEEVVMPGKKDSAAAPGKKGAAKADADTEL